MRERIQDVPSGTTEPRGSTPFQQFMEQLEEAMAEAAGEPPPKPEKETIPPPVVTAPTPVVRPTSSIRPAEFRAVSGSFDAPKPVDHDAHGFGSENPLSEELFEGRAAFGRRPAARPETFDPHGLHTEATPTKRRRLGDLRRRLKSAEAAREAFVLQTIFGPRGGRRSENR